MLTLAVLDDDVRRPGTEVTLVWGEEDGGTSKPTVEPHVQRRSAAMVSPVPYVEVVPPVLCARQLALRAGVNTWPGVPRIPASAGALIWDPAGRLLILEPTYKKGWTIPGGQIDADGESPWDACRRETREECGLVAESGRLACVDYLPPKSSRPGGVRFLFDCGTFPKDVFGGVVLQETEIAGWRLSELPEALELLSGPLRRRISQTAGRTDCVYLEDGRPVAGVTAAGPEDRAAG